MAEPERKMNNKGDKKIERKITNYLFGCFIKGIGHLRRYHCKILTQTIIENNWDLSKDEDFKKLLKLYNAIKSQKFTRHQLRELYHKFGSNYDNFITFLNLWKKIKRFKLENFINFNRLILLVQTKKDYLDVYLKAAKLFEHYNLEENGQADFDNLVKLIEVSKQDVEAIVEILFKTKVYGKPLSQKQIIRYFDSNPPLTKDLYSLLEAWFLIHDNNLEITFEDLFTAAQFGRKPNIFVQNYLKIKKFQIPLSLREFISLPFEQSIITETIKALSKVFIYNIDINFDLVKFYLLNRIDITPFLRSLIKFVKAGFDFEFKDLYNYSLVGDLDDLFDALIYYKEKKLDEKNHFPSIKEILSDLRIIIEHNKNVKPKDFIKAVQKAFDVREKLFSALEYNEIYQIVKNDYMDGINVYALLLAISQAPEDLNLNYELAKLYEKTYGLKKFIHHVQHPILLTSDKKYKIITRDNIEMLIEFQIEATLNSKNFFKGVDKDMLFERIYALLATIIQSKYNHDQISENINNISSEILKKLEEENVLLDKTTIKLKDISKWIPHKIIITKIEVVKDTFREIEKVREEFKLHHELKHLEVELKKAEIEVKKAWAKDGNVKYLILKDEPLEQHPHHSHSENSHSSSHQKNQQKNENQDKHH